MRVGQSEALHMLLNHSLVLRNRMTASCYANDTSSFRQKPRTDGDSVLSPNYQRHYEQRVDFVARWPQRYQDALWQPPRNDFGRLVRQGARRRGEPP
jgi:hypothetical protein